MTAGGLRARLTHSLTHSDLWIWAILLLGLVVRLCLIAWTSDYDAFYDSADFYRQATSIAGGDGYPESAVAVAGGPSAFRPPAYPYFAGGIFAVFGDDINVGRIANALLGTAATLFVVLIARELWDRRIAVAAGLTAALFPPLVLWETAFLSESLFITLELGIVLLMLLLRRSSRSIGWALVGILCGVAALTRANGFLLVIPAVIGAYAIGPRRSAGALVAPLTVVVCAVVTVGPWTIRNAIEFDRFIPTTTQSGFGLAGTYNEETMNSGEFSGTWVGSLLPSAYGSILKRADLNEAELNDELRERSVDFALSHPEYVAKASVLNILRTFGILNEQFAASLQVTGGTIGATGVAVLRWTAVLLTVAALAGCLLLGRPGPPRWGPLFVWAVPVLMIGSAIPISGDPRYRAPVDPFLALLAGVALVWLWDRLRRSSATASSHEAEAPARSVTM